jgi:NAD(P)-dependent dehydrogenase (short-subunit alcohol dehydrogenase family)
MGRNRGKEAVMPSILVTGANRGIGLELTRTFAGQGWQVFACCRTPEKAVELQALASDSKSVTVQRLDVTDPEQIAALAIALSGVPIDILLNNAGFLGPTRQGFGETEEAGWIEAFQVNTIAPLRMAEAFVEHVAASERRVIATMGSVMGSIAENASGGYYAYRTAKAAAHMVVKGLAVDLADRGIIAVVFHPGWVRTRMGGAEAPLSPAESAAGLTRVLLGLSAKDNGSFYDYLGEVRPW